MATLKKLLEAARLIERSDSSAPSASNNDADIDALIQRAAAAEQASDQPRADASATIGSAPLSAGLDVEEGIVLEQIYALQGVAACGFPIERLFKLVDGLKALDPTTRRAAILAMDVADETWSMDQVIADARNKVNALRQYQANLQQNVDAVVSANQSKAAALEADRDQKVADLRAQIQNLEAQIQEALTTSAAEVATLQSQSESNRAALRREAQRLDAEIRRMEELVNQYGTAPK